jgi:two-component system phosphate regulon sensor histidine kinase PhoR
MAVSFGTLFFRAAQRHEIASIKDKAYLVAQLLNRGNYEYADRLRGGDTRITIISPEGYALSDNYGAADLSYYRGDRPEFVQAIADGSGEAVRRSATFGADTYYYAIKLQDGNVLRLSRTLSGLREVFTSILTAMIFVTLIILASAYLIVRRMTRIIIKPLVEVDFESEEAISSSALSESLYEELWPYIKKIDNQKKEIAKQMKTLRSRAETIEAIIENMREGLVILDEKGLVMAINKSALDIFYLPHENADEVIRKNIQNVYRDPEFIKGVKECLKGASVELSFVRDKRIYNAVLNPVISEEKSLHGSVFEEHCHGAIVFFLDSTEQFNADKQRREFSANVSHELKTPLTTISALSEMMSNGMTKTEDVLGFAHKISKQTQRLIHIIDDIIRLSEFDESKVKKDFTIFDVHELAQSVTTALQDKAHEKSVTLKLTGESFKLNANNRLLDELMYNLIDNAIKYNKEGGTVTVDLCKENEFCKISVTDTGIGIPKEHQGHVFERFYRVDSSRSKKTGGTGLGLSIVKHIAEHHNGKIVLESVEGAGTTIVCYIAL